MEKKKKHLERSGRLILNFDSPNPELISKTEDKPITKKQGTFFVNKQNQIIEIFIKHNKKLISFKQTFIYKKEFELLLMLAGFKKWKVYGGFNYQPLKTFKQEMVWVIR